jgi:membrane associated rhomboid family serine protease
MPMKLEDVIPTDSPVTCVIMVSILICSCIGFYSRYFFMRMILHPYSVFRQNQFYRLITGDLVSNDPVHLALNEAMLSFFGGNLEQELNRRSVHGSLLFLFIYFFSWICGIVYTTLKYRNDFEYSTAGASGSILGCAVSFMILQPDMIAFYLPVIGGLKNKYDALILILVLIVYKMKTNNPMINHELHLFGAIGGIIGTVLLIYLKI